jgi:hypothetical protein
MKLNFEINRDYLIAHTIWCWDNERFSSSTKHRADLLKFINAVWDNHRSTYELLSGRMLPNSFVTSKQPFNSLKTVADELELAMDQIELTPEYRKLFDQTKNYLKICQTQWQKNLDQTISIIKELTNLNLDRELTIIITHPSLRNGYNLGQINNNYLIAWGTTEKWPNYITVYLWHEILHSYFDSNNTTHALIQLITDNELRIRLNGGQYPPFEGHSYLIDKMNEILPSWKEYLLSSNKDIHSFEKSLSK